MENTHICRRFANLGQKAFKISPSSFNDRLLSESGTGFYLQCTVRVTSGFNGGRNRMAIGCETIIFYMIAGLILLW